MFMNNDLILCMFIEFDQISSNATFLCDPDLDFSVQGLLLILVNLCVKVCHYSYK